MPAVTILKIPTTNYLFLSLVSTGVVYTLFLRNVYISCPIAYKQVIFPTSHNSHLLRFHFFHQKCSDPQYMSWRGIFTCANVILSKKFHLSGNSTSIKTSAPLSKKYLITKLGSMLDNFKCKCVEMKYTDIKVAMCKWNKIPSSIKRQTQHEFNVGIQ